MQTFLPVASLDFEQSAKVLDNRRLNKQALEGWQIMLTLLELDPQGYPRKPKGWSNHPAVKMWRDHESLLFSYVMAMVREWKARGYKSTIGDKASSTLIQAYNIGSISELGSVPSWMQDLSKFEAIASTHRQALLVKDYSWYSQFGWAEDTGVEPTTYEYIWE
jgi:hypothetical protein